MPTYVHGDLWDELGRANLLFITTNALVRQGRLVMGAGVAREAAQRFPELPAVFAQQLRERVEPGGDYYLLPGVRTIGPTWVCAFQTKRHPAQPSPPELIARSAERLAAIAGRFERIALACPGVGLGGLRFEQVEPLLAVLPANVFVYRRGASLRLRPPPMVQPSKL